MMVDSASGILCFVQIHSSGPFPSVSSLQKTLEGVRWSSAVCDERLVSAAGSSEASFCDPSSAQTLHGSSSLK
ncbi:hypothetical protein AV530_003577 [Patagioenas fasciata monilis]|uniref:Uncharacterized protein n=1 Tax=Patagioenas fasciata monilis TaxID=372326 RepID=A0A1V4KYD5_PATFA|nr:hypothetical protein AV530_003577 [Patagioenas fasciata monilis]